jgi:hypothetical protein
MRVFVAGLAIALLSACALPLPSRPGPAAMSESLTRSRDFSGSYLSLGFVPDDQMNGELSALRQRLGFVGMDRAVPPRDSEHLHVTVGYFRQLRPHLAERLRVQYQGQSTYLRLTGHGVAQGQVAYLSVEGVEPLRDWLRAAGIVFEADDAHCTFAVHPDRPRDVHGVPKPMQEPFKVRQVLAELHLCQGKRALW